MGHHVQCAVRSSVLQNCLNSKDVHLTATVDAFCDETLWLFEISDLWKLFHKVGLTTLLQIFDRVFWRI